MEYIHSAGTMRFHIMLKCVINAVSRVKRVQNTSQLHRLGHC